MIEPYIVRPEDLEWWLSKAPDLKWRFASSMQDVPHSYVVRHKSLQDPEYLRAFGAIRTFGQPGKFYDRTQLYLHDESRDVRWWPMTRFHWQSKILNQAEDGRMYGKQNAPSTLAHAGWSAFDAVGAYYDEIYRQVEKPERTAFWSAVAVLSSSKPGVLDLGTGTGGTFDAQVASSHNSEVVDPSTGMLNDLVMKYPDIGRIHAMTAGDYFAMETGTKFDVVTASFGSASFLSEDDIRQARKVARTAVVLSFYASHYEPLDSILPDSTALESTVTHASVIRVQEIGNYVNVTLKGQANGR